MSKATDKLSKLATFGALAGAKPAASAQVVVETAATVPQSLEPVPEVTTQPVTEPKAAGKGSAAKNPPKLKASVLAPERKPLVRNVIFTNEDQIELERLEATMRQAGIIRPSIADIVRIALRVAEPTPEQAAEVFRSAKLLDGRTFEGKRLKQGKTK